MNPDFLAYHKSIAEELKITQDRIRHLIGSAHWLTDGEHKEAVLRRSLRAHLPEAYHVGRGFVCHRDRSSNQIDILVVAKEKPTLFKDGELILVTPDAVRAIIEVKTSIASETSLADVLKKLADQVEAVRQAKNPTCWAGLFVFDDPSLESKSVLAAISKSSRGSNRFVNCVALGPEVFVRYWDSHSEDPSRYPAWHSYAFSSQATRGLAHAYFVSNVVWDLTNQPSETAEYAWFPILHPGGKEEFRMHRLSARDGTVTTFE